MSAAEERVEAARVALSTRYSAEPGSRERDAAYDVIEAALAAADAVSPARGAACGAVMFSGSLCTKDQGHDGHHFHDDPWAQGAAELDREACDTCGGTGVLGDDECPGGCDQGRKALVAQRGGGVLDREACEIVAVHTPDLIHEGPNGEDDGQHLYCVECGVLPIDALGLQYGPGHVVLMLARANLLAARGETPVGDDVVERVVGWERFSETCRLLRERTGEVSDLRAALAAARAGEAEGKCASHVCDYPDHGWRPAQRDGEAVDREALVERVSDWLAESPAASHGVDSTDEGYSQMLAVTDDEWRALADHLADRILAARGEAAPSVSAEAVGQALADSGAPIGQAWHYHHQEPRPSGWVLDFVRVLGIEVRP